MATLKLTQEIVQREVQENHLTDIEIAQKYNASYTRVGDIRRKLNIKPNRAKKSSARKISKEQLEELYDKYGTDARVGNALGIPSHTIKKLRIKYDINALKYGERPEIQLTHEQKEMLFGIMLGDGYCRKEGQSAMISIDHSIKQKDYVDYIASQLTNVLWRTYEHTTGISKKTGKRYKCYCLFLQQNKAFDFFRDSFYINDIKEIPLELLEEYYTPRALAYHYMDDGSYSGHKCIIATCGFTEEQNNQLRDFLYKKYNIETTLQKGNKIYICQNSLKLFFSLIKPYICESMAYKIKDVS